MKNSIIYIIIVGAIAGIFGVVDFVQLKGSDEVREVVLDRTKGQLIESEVVKVNVYIPKDDFETFEIVQHEVEKTMDRDKNLRKVIEEVSMELFTKKIIAKELAVKNIFVSSGDIYINLLESKELVKNDKKALGILYAISNTINDAGLGERIKVMIADKEMDGMLAEFYTKRTSL